MPNSPASWSRGHRPRRGGSTRGAASAIVGLLPWLITGARLPLQNLWATDSLDMPFALLPFSQYFLSFTAAMLLVGSAIAGIVGRATTAKNRRAALRALIGGVALVQVIALAQTAITVALGIGLDRHRTAAILYLVLITGGIFVSLLVGLGMLALIARAPKAGTLVALSIAAVAASSWLSGFLFPINTFATSSPLTNFFSELVRFLPAILIGAAIAWCGVNTRGRIVATVVAVMVLILGPILVTAIFNAAGSRVLAPYPDEMLSYGIGSLHQLPRTRRDLAPAGGASRCDRVHLVRGKAKHQAFAG